MTDGKPRPPTLDYAARRPAPRRPLVEVIPPYVRWLAIGGLIVGLAFHWLLSPRAIEDRFPAAPANSRTAVFEFARALDAFHDAYGYYPAGDGLAIMRALHGEDPGSNPRGIDFLSVRTRLNIAGVICDGWDNPLVFRRGGPVPLVYSIGANGIDEQGGGDDILLPLFAPSPATVPGVRPTSGPSSP